MRAGARRRQGPGLLLQAPGLAAGEGEEAWAVLGAGARGEAGSRQLGQVRGLRWAAVRAGGRRRQGPARVLQAAGLELLLRALALAGGWREAARAGLGVGALEEAGWEVKGQEARGVGVGCT